MEGCYAGAVRSQMELINNRAERLRDDLKDTIIVISADHGLINISEEIFLNEIPEIDECLIMPPSIESRAVSLFVKPEMLDIFEQRFNKYFKGEFILIPKEKVMESGILGSGKTHKKVSDFLGDYLACATGNKMIRYATYNMGERHSYKGQHAGLTEEEMLVPLIVIEK
jgi:arylsulfatase A-like enzyme